MEGMQVGLQEDEGRGGHRGVTRSEKWSTALPFPRLPTRWNEKLFINYLVCVRHYKNAICWVLVAHACNLSYSGGRDQEDRGLKPVQANSS
jgi:hypothetical protein